MLMMCARRREYLSSSAFCCLTALYQSQFKRDHPMPYRGRGPYSRSNSCASQADPAWYVLLHWLAVYSRNPSAKFLIEVRAHDQEDRDTLWLYLMVDFT